ncbi:transporter substrate-binding domain-containing protein [Secundilactobacillus malefermentans]|uniref:Solute-binding protein family 3/N-terminal domain-containing protein n=1 Tax=Secundilactobacillus malefermentans TaxID=176292 RepID=A0A4R5NHE0_9LACO|nr:transporter substrate-binding domain-containing protein [Secundilactobacillus malefermentans]KRM59139.1 Collagen binding protein [Secundilactobacillus malefermentans DSM 5705 = KCTC 3548]QEA31452.1 transporter substrate-binding domain-containing protein [Secundilactobacillus malefermentans]TDG73949.1 hypothetical protein C5L31_002100 [Secundilactobacillus malefermentans]
MKFSKRIKQLSVLAGALLVAVTLTACGSSNKSSSSKSTYKSELVNKGTLTVGLEGAFKPYSYRQNGKLVGFEVDLSRDIAKKLGLKVKFEPTKWDSLIAGVGSGKFDAALNNITVTPERQKTYRFSTPYINSQYVLVTRKGDNSIKGINDIKGKRLVEGTGSDNAAIAKKYGATVVPNGDFPTTLQMLKQKRGEATINSLGSWLVYAKDNSTAGLKYQKLDPEKVPVAKVAALLNKKSPKLQKKISQAIKDLKADGTLTKLSKKYFGADINN